MKVPLSWLREYVDVPTAVPALVDRLTRAGMEVANVRFVGVPAPEGLPPAMCDVGPAWAPDKVMLARVLKTDPHPNADRLKLVTVEHGAGQPKVVLTGAPNIATGDTGQRVILALTGAVLYDGHAQPKQLKELKPAVIRGTPSDSMLCSAFELGISEEHEGIILLGDDLGPPGTPLVEVMSEVVLDIDVLPNMARCLAMLGIAREVSALFGSAVRPPETKPAEHGAPITGTVAVQIEDSALSRRYAARLVRNVQRGPAPAWMRRRLELAGMRPIDNVVDITNFVMLEWGQPLHAFDFDVLVNRAGSKAPTIAVRPARPGEKLTTLDGAERTLSPENLVIADTAGPIALAGVMGGRDTEVTGQTKNVLLESANFDFVSIRRTMRQFDLPSEASLRFSKGIHPELVRPALDRAALLLEQYANGETAQGVVDSYPAPIPPQVIDLPMSAVERLLGVAFPTDEAERILKALAFTVERTGPDRLRVTTPPNRLDIQEGVPDLVEDLIRVRGFEHLPATLDVGQLPEQRGNADLGREEFVRDRLVDAGLQEVICYSLTSPEAEAKLGPAEGEYVRLLNPIDKENRTVMRRRLLPGVLEVAALNLRHADTVKLFEVGSVYLPRTESPLPDEPRRLALVLSGRRREPFWEDTAAADDLDFYDLKGVVEGLCADLHLPPLKVQPGGPAYLHPGRSATLVNGKGPIGHFGQLHPRTAKALGLTARPVLVGEFDLEAILKLMPERYTYEAVPRFPAALRDVAVIVPEEVPAERVLAELRAGGGDLLRDVRLFDVYRGESIPAETKSLAFALTYQASDRTLTDKEVDKAHGKIEDRLKHVLKAQIRGKEPAGA